uniref:Uncharacterized protein n=1 Tax=Plectus sambesii TaxID=2011161 RepID=A0A914XBZ7_9BILA
MSGTRTTSASSTSTERRNSMPRPPSSYGRRSSAIGVRESSATTAEVRMKSRQGAKIEKKNIETEKQFNEKTKGVELRRIKSEVQRRRAAVQSKHHGDENLTNADLSLSMPERMMRLTVGRKTASRSPTSSGPNSPNRVRSFEQVAGDVSPVLREKSYGGASPTRRRNSRAEISNAKLAMMKKKLSPLPSRERTLVKAADSDDDDDYSR